MIQQVYEQVQVKTTFAEIQERNDLEQQEKKSLMQKELDLIKIQKQFDEEAS